MGFRTVVMLNNDQAYAWQNDPKLGQRIMLAANSLVTPDRLPYGAVVECVHADTQTLSVLSDYDNFKSIAQAGWYRDSNQDDVVLQLLKEAADTLGYRMVRKSVKGDKS